MSDNTFKMTAIKPDILVMKTTDRPPIICIDSEGRLFWHEREVETDGDFRAAMLDLADYFTGKRNTRAAPEPVVDDAVREAVVKIARVMDNFAQLHSDNAIAADWAVIRAFLRERGLP